MSSRRNLFRYAERKPRLNRIKTKHVFSWMSARENLVETRSKNWWRRMWSNTYFPTWVIGQKHIGDSKTDVSLLDMHQSRFESVRVKKMESIRTGGLERESDSNRKNRIWNRLESKLLGTGIEKTGIESVFDSYYLFNLSAINYRSSWQLRVRTLIDWIWFLYCVD